MKIRNGFVSNSSSSNYIVEYGKNINLEDFVPCDEGNGDYTHISAIGSGNIAKYIMEDYGVYNHYSFVWFISMCSKISRIEENGLQVAYITISDYDKNTREILKELDVDMEEV